MRWSDAQNLCYGFDQRYRTSPSQMITHRTFWNIRHVSSSILLIEIHERFVIGYLTDFKFLDD